MSVDRREVDRIAGLARLRLDDDEAERLTAEMNRILEHAERLRDVDAADATADGVGAVSEFDGGDPDAGASSAAGPAMGGVRIGDPERDVLRAEPASFAPEWDASFFVVPPPPGVQAEAAGSDDDADAGASDVPSPSGRGGRV